MPGQDKMEDRLLNQKTLNPAGINLVADEGLNRICAVQRPASRSVHWRWCENQTVCPQLAHASGTKVRSSHVHSMTIDQLPSLLDHDGVAVRRRPEEPRPHIHDIPCLLCNLHPRHVFLPLRPTLTPDPAPLSPAFYILRLSRRVERPWGRSGARRTKMTEGRETYVG